MSTAAEMFVPPKAVDETTCEPWRTPCALRLAVPRCPGCGMRHDDGPCPVEPVVLDHAAEVARLHAALVAIRDHLLAWQAARPGSFEEADEALCAALEAVGGPCPSCGEPVAPDSACAPCRAEAGL